MPDDKDSYAFERARVERICRELWPGCDVGFDEQGTFITFRVTCGGVVLVEQKEEWVPVDLADESDAELREWLSDHRL